MSLELIAIIAILVTSALEMAGLAYLGAMLRSMNTKMGADDAALYLQGHRIEHILKEMRGELTKE